MAKTAQKRTSKLNNPTRSAAQPMPSAIAPATKSAAVLALLTSKTGTSISELAAATGWQNHSIRGFLSGTVKKKLGHEVVSVVANGERRYQIAG